MSETTSSSVTMEEIPPKQEMNQMLNRMKNKTNQNETQEPVLKKKYSHTWTQKDDDLLEEAVRIHGACHWRLIAEMVPGRTRKQCRERYCNHLDPKINKKSWSPEEDELLLRLHNQLGNKWSLIKTYLPGRTANSIKNRYTSKIKKNCPSMSVFTPVDSSLYSVL